MPVTHYGSRFSGTLRERLEEIAANDEERMKLHDEIDASRLLAGESLELLDKVLSAPIEEVNPKTRSAIIKNARGALSHVASLVSMQAKLEVAMGATFSTEALNAVVVKIQDIIIKELEDQPDVVERITDKISKLRLLDEDASSVTINI